MNDRKEVNICEKWKKRRNKTPPGWSRHYHTPALLLNHTAFHRLADKQLNYLPYKQHILVYCMLCSSVVRAFAHRAMGRQIDPSWGGPIELFLVPACAPRLVYKGCGMCYPVCGMVHIKEPLLLIGKSILCGSSRFPLSLSEWYFTICLTPYNHK